MWKCGKSQLDVWLTDIDCPTAPVPVNVDGFTRSFLSIPRFHRVMAIIHELAHFLYCRLKTT